MSLDPARPRPLRPRRDFPGRRWLGILLRSLHLAGVVLVGASFLGGGVDRMAAAGLMAATGFALFGLDLWANPAYLGEWAGAFIPFKLMIVLAMALVPAETAPAIFWGVLLASSMIAHAPGYFRHRRIRA